MWINYDPRPSVVMEKAPVEHTGTCWDMLVMGDKWVTVAGCSAADHGSYLDRKLMNSVAMTMCKTLINI